MILDHRDGHALPLLELLYGCRVYGGYREQADGTIKGLYYAPFADYVHAEHEPAGPGATAPVRRRPARAAGRRPSGHGLGPQGDPPP